MNTSEQVLKEKRPRAIDLLSEEERELFRAYQIACKNGGKVTATMRAASATYARALKIVNEGYKKRQVKQAVKINTERYRHDLAYQKKVRDQSRTYHAAHREECTAKQREYNARKKAERLVRQRGITSPAAIALGVAVG